VQANCKEFRANFHAKKTFNFPAPKQRQEKLNAWFG